MYLELEFRYCFSIVDFVEYLDQRRWNHTETVTSYRLRTIGNTHWRSFDILTLLGCFYSLQLLSTPHIYINEDSVIKEYFQNKSAKWSGMGN